jgi:hypothetical protein
MRLVTWHFFILTFLESVLVVGFKFLANLNIEATFVGFLTNLGINLVVLGLCGLLAWGSLYFVRSAEKVTLKQALSNSLVHTFSTIIYFYGTAMLLWNWPINLERTTPDYFIDREFTFLPGLGLVLLAIAIWGLGLARTFSRGREKASLKVAS